MLNSAAVLCHLLMEITGDWVSSFPSNFGHACNPVLTISTWSMFWAVSCTGRLNLVGTCWSFNASDKSLQLPSCNFNCISNQFPICISKGNVYALICLFYLITCNLRCCVHSKEWFEIRIGLPTCRSEQISLHSMLIVSQNGYYLPAYNITILQPGP